MCVLVSSTSSCSSSSSSCSQSVGRRSRVLLTMLEGFEREPEEDDGVEEAVQTMGPENLPEDEREKERVNKMEEN